MDPGRFGRQAMVFEQWSELCGIVESPSNSEPSLAVCTLLNVDFEGARFILHLAQQLRRTGARGAVAS